MMNLAKISANGQITVPVEIRRALKLKAGDKMLFLQRENGEIVVGNASEEAIRKAQETVSGIDFTEEEILSEVMKLRYGENRL